MTDCIFCKISNKQIPAEIISDNDTCFVIKDIAPKAPIHYLIIPKKHVKDIQALSVEDMPIANDIFRHAQQLSKTIPGASDFKLIFNSGFNAGQRVFHLHGHFIAGKLFNEV